MEKAGNLRHLATQQSPSPIWNLELENKFSALGMDEQEQAHSGQVSESAEPESSVCTESKKCVSTGDYLLLHSLFKLGGR